MVELHKLEVTYINKKILAKLYRYGILEEGAKTITIKYEGTRQRIKKNTLDKLKYSENNLLGHCEYITLDKSRIKGARDEAIQALNLTLTNKYNELEKVTQALEEYSNINEIHIVKMPDTMFIQDITEDMLEI